MLCPIMSKVVTTPETNKYGEPTGHEYPSLFEVQCIGCNCEIWDKGWSMCGLKERK